MSSTEGRNATFRSIGASEVMHSLSTITAILFAIVIIVTPALAQGSGGSISGTYPDGPWNGQQIQYSLSGATFDRDPEDRTSGFHPTRYYRGTLGNKRLSIQGKALMEWKSAQYVTVELWAGGERVTYTSPHPRNNIIGGPGHSESFSLSMPIPKDAVSGGFKINLVLINPAYGNRSVNVTGQFSREVVGTPLSEGLLGIGSIGLLPGPETLLQALLGVLGPGLLAILIGLLGGHLPGISFGLGGGEDPRGPGSIPDDRESGDSPGGAPFSGLSPTDPDGFVLPEPGIAGDTLRIDGRGVTLADKLFDSVTGIEQTAAEVGGTLVHGSVQTALDVGVALKDGVISFGAPILEGYKQIGLFSKELLQDAAAGRLSKADLVALYPQLLVVFPGETQVIADMFKHTWDTLPTWDTLKKEVLPIDEFKSFSDPNASLEEKLWAVPSIALKTARILMISRIFGKDYAAASVPGTGKLPSLIPSARQAHELSALAAKASTSAAECKRQISNLKPLKGRTLPRPQRTELTRLKSSLTEAKNAEATINAVKNLNEAVPDLSKMGTYQQVQKALSGNPKLKRLLDDGIRYNNGGELLKQLRESHLMNKDVHTALTARKLQLQEQVILKAQQRIITLDAKATLGRGEQPPRQYHTLNATEGNRTLIRRANVDVDLDSTMINIKHVPKTVCRRILNSELKRAGFTQKQLDVNIYLGNVADPTGAAANVQATIENIGQTTATGGVYNVHVSSKGTIHVSKQFTQQGRESILQARLKNIQPGQDPTTAWEGHQGSPIQAAKGWEAQKTQLNGLNKAYKKGNYSQMCKFINRLKVAGMEIDPETVQLVKKVNGQKDPFLAKQMLKNAGILSPDDLMNRLRIPIQ